MAPVESSAAGRLSRLSAGPLTALLEGSLLRRICWDGREVLREFTAPCATSTGAPSPPATPATASPGRTAPSPSASPPSTRRATSTSSGTARSPATAAGEVRYRFDGRARSAFRRNRIGLCLLHPMDLAGQPVEVETPQGIVRGAFPAAISPHQPFLDIVALRQRAGDATLEVRFEGDLFEMEDQRNWTDASYKTYSTPLRLPYPVAVAPGDRVRQTITLRRLPPAAGERAGIASGAPAPVAVWPARPAPLLADDAPVGVRLTTTTAGTLPPLGLGLASDGRPLAPEALARLRHVRPAHLHVPLDLSAPDGAPEAPWRATLQRAARPRARPSKRPCSLRSSPPRAGPDSTPWRPPCASCRPGHGVARRWPGRSSTPRAAPSQTPPRCAPRGGPWGGRCSRGRRRHPRRLRHAEPRGRRRRAAPRSDGRRRLRPQPPGARVRRPLPGGDPVLPGRGADQRPAHRRRPSGLRRPGHPQTATQSGGHRPDRPGGRSRRPRRSPPGDVLRRRLDAGQRPPPGRRRAPPSPTSRPPAPSASSPGTAPPTRSPTSSPPSSRSPGPPCCTSPPPTPWRWRRWPWAPGSASACWSPI